MSSTQQSSIIETFCKYRNKHRMKRMKLVIILTCLVALSRQQQQFPGFGNTFGNLGNAFGNAFNAIFTNSANQLSNSVRPIGSPNVQQRPPANSFNSPGFFAAVRPIPNNRPVTIAPVVRPTGVPVASTVRPTAVPVVPVNRPTAVPVVPVNRPTGSVVPTGRKRRTVVEKVVDTPAAYTADNDTPKPTTTTEAPSSYWPVPGAGWFYG